MYQQDKHHSNQKCHGSLMQQATILSTVN